MMWQRARSFSIETAHFTSLPSISLSYPVIYFQLYSNYCWLKRIHIPMLLLLQMWYIMVYISISIRYSHDIPTKTWLDVTILNFKFPTFPSFVSDFSLGISSSIRSRLLSSSGRDDVGLATKHRSHPRDARVAGGVSGPATAGTAGSAGNARSAGSAGSASASAKGLSGFSEAGLQIDDLNFISYI